MVGAIKGGLPMANSSTTIVYVAAKDILILTKTVEEGEGGTGRGR